jgi:hypothetical protein
MPSHHPTEEHIATITQRPTEEHIATVQRYLAQAFPGSGQSSWWEENRTAQVFSLTDGAVLRHIVIDGGLFQACPDCAAALRDSEFTDYVRETRSPTRCFHLTWEAGALHIRSKPL